jgi:hypothetical protein
MAAGTFDRAVGFSLFTLQVTHKIDANTDIERDHIVSTLQDARVGVSVDVIKDFSSGYHSRNGGGDSIETDGDLPMIDVRAVPVDSASIAVSDQADARRTALAEHRPVPTTLGFLLMLLRVVAGGVTVALTIVDWRGFIQSQLADAGEVTLDPATRAIVEVVVAVVMAMLAVGLVIYLVLAVLVFLGSNWARIAAMSLSALFIVVTALDYFNGGPQISLRNNLLGLPLDILVVLALSSQRARLWARRRRQRRRGIDVILSPNAAADDTTVR